MPLRDLIKRIIPKPSEYAGHPFVPLVWDSRCGHLSHPQADRCFRPWREHLTPAGGGR